MGSLGALAAALLRSLERVNAAGGAWGVAKDGVAAAATAGGRGSGWALGALGCGDGVMVSTETLGRLTRPSRKEPPRGSPWGGDPEALRVEGLAWGDSPAVRRLAMASGTGESARHRRSGWAYEEGAPVIHTGGEQLGDAGSIRA